MKSAATIAICACVMVSIPALAQQQVYKWVDENGTVHYSSQPRENAEIFQTRSTRVSADERTQRSREALAQSVDDVLARRQEQRGANAESRQQQEQAERNCQVAREAVQTIESRTRVAVQQEDGTLKYLDDDERLAQLEKSRQAVDEWCG